jgi:hypothetical protein
MNKWLEIFLGLVLVIISVYFWGLDIFGLGEAALIFLKGGVIWLLLTIGLILVLLGISDLKR